MPRATRKPNKQLKTIVLEETNDGRDVVRYLKSVFMDIEDAPRLFGLSPKEYTRTHKIAAARILARLGLEEGKRYLRRNYVQTPFKRVNPEDEDGPKRDMAASTADLYRLVRKETNDGRDIMIYFVGIMKGYHNEYKPHLRMAAAKELIRHIEFDYDDQPSETRDAASARAQSANPTNPDSDSESYHQPADLLDQANPLYPDSDDPTTADLPVQANPAYPENPDSDKITPNQENPPSDADAPDPYLDYSSRNCAPEAESIYQSIIRRASDQPNELSAKREAERLIEEFNQFVADRDPRRQPVAVPDDLLSKSLSIQTQDPESYVFDPADYYDLDRDGFFFCTCGGCDDCDELEFFFEFIRELEEDIAFLYEDP